MLKYLHQLSAFFFYLIGSSFFVAYLLYRNKIWSAFSSDWLQLADLPFAFAAILYGGISLYLSLAIPHHKSRGLAWGITIPLTLMFLVLCLMNFWGAWPFTT